MLAFMFPHPSELPTVPKSWIMQVAEAFDECGSKREKITACCESNFCKCHSCILRPPPNMWLDYQCYCWWCDQPSINGLFLHCHHCYCENCAPSLDAPRKESQLLVDLEAEQRGVFGCDPERQSGSESPISEASLHEGQFEPSNYGEENIQPQFLETSESMDQHVEEDPPTKKRRLLKEAISNAQETHRYSGLVIFTIPKGSKVITFDENGKETSCLRTEESSVGRPIRVSVSSYSSKRNCSVGPKRR